MRRRRPLRQIRVPAELSRQLLAAAAASPGQEICGLIGGHADRARSLYPVANVASDQARAFLMEPVGQIAALRTMRERGEELVGIYHSHPASAARPSATDVREAAYPDIAYLIISLADPATPVVAAFVGDGRGFRGIPIRVIDGDQGSGAF